MTLPLPRKLDTALVKSLAELGQKTFTFASDVVEYLRVFRSETTVLETRVTVIEEVFANGYTAWVPDAPPLAPHACNDEFTDGALAAKWSTWDPAALLTVGMDTDRRMVTLTGTGNGGSRLAGIYQAVPESEFAFYAKVHMNSILERGGIGLFVGGDLVGAPSTADAATAYTLGVAAAATPQIGHQVWTAYNAAGASNLINYGRPGYRMYIRMRCNGTNVRCDFSDDGVCWTEMDTAITTAFTPAYFGLFLYTFEAVSFKGMADFFRVFSGSGTSGIDATKIGRRLAFGVQ